MAQVAQLPKYVHELNHILLALDAQPDKRWNRTQRELGEALGLAQPVLSVRLKTLQEQGRIRKGESLPVRGKNHAIELIDATPFEGPIRAEKVKRHKDDRVLPEEVEEQLALPPSLELGEFTPEKIGMAVLKTLHDLWERQEKSQREQEQLENAVMTFRSHLAKEHRLVQQLEREKEELAANLEEAEARWVEVREQMNKLIIAQGEATQRGGGHYKLRDVLDEESLKILQVLTSP